MTNQQENTKTKKVYLPYGLVKNAINILDKTVATSAYIPICGLYDIDAVIIHRGEVAKNDQ